MAKDKENDKDKDFCDLLKRYPAPLCTYDPRSVSNASEQSLVQGLALILGLRSGIN